MVDDLFDLTEVSAYSLRIIHAKTQSCNVQCPVSGTLVLGYCCKTWRHEESTLDVRCSRAQNRPNAYFAVDTEDSVDTVRSIEL